MNELLYDKNGRMAYITLNRPQKVNSISRELADALLKTLSDFDNDPDLWVAIITGAGEKYFSAGADLKDEKHLYEPEKWESAYFRGLFSVKKPMIAAVNGYCLGAGFSIALACDIRIASENARFGTPDQKLNTVDCAASVLLSRYIPAAVAMEILFTGEPIDAAEAYRIGLVNRVVPFSELINTSEAFARKICQNGPLALWACKEINKRAHAMAIDDSASLFEALAGNVLKSEDTKEGIMAFLEKRKPRWQDR